MIKQREMAGWGLILDYFSGKILKYMTSYYFSM